MKSTSYLFLLGVMLGAASGCSESDSEMCLSGTLDCPCINGTKCDFGYTCENEVCVEKTSDTGTYPIDSDTGTSVFTDTETDTGQPVDTETDTGQPVDTATETTPPDSDTGSPDTDTATINDTDPASEACHVTVHGWDTAFSANENSFLTIVNQKRAAGATCGSTPYGAAPALTMDPNLQCADRYYVYDMHAGNYGPSGISIEALKARAVAAGFEGTFMAYGAALGSQAQYATIAAVVQFFMDRDSSCKNLMAPDAKYLGVGYGFYTPNYFWVYSTGR